MTPHFVRRSANTKSHEAYIVRSLETV